VKFCRGAWKGTHKSYFASTMIRNRSTPAVAKLSSDTNMAMTGYDINVQGRQNLMWSTLHAYGSAADYPLYSTFIVGCCILQFGRSVSPVLLSFSSITTAFRMKQSGGHRNKRNSASENKCHALSFSTSIGYV
jgi:hypothetical protein